MPSRNLPPLEAAILPDALPRKSWVPFIMGSILVGSCLLAVVIGIWGLVKLVESIDRPGTFAGGAGSTTWQSTRDKQAEYRESFKVPVKVPQDADVPQVEKLLKKYVTAATTNDVGGLARLVDVNAFLERMEDHPDMPRLDRTERKALLDELNVSLQLPGDFTAFRLMDFRRLPAAGSAVADVIFQTAAGLSEPCRIWLQQNERAWSVVDWEIIQQGKSEAGQRAGRWRSGQEYWTPSLDDYLSELERADARYDQGDIQGATSLLQKADQGTLPGYVHKEMQLAVASRYYRYRQHQLAVDCLLTIEVRDEVPGYYVIRALSYQALGEEDQAIAAAADYERLCGFSPDVARAKALALAQLGRKEEAIVEFKRLLEFDPSDEVARKASDEIRMATGE